MFSIFVLEMSENKSLHNALRQVRLQAGKFQICGFSISGLATYLQLPELDFCVDMGECPVSAIGLNHVFLTHAHGDHSRCLMRHHSLRRMMGIERPSVYYIPAELAKGAENWIHAEAMFEGVPEARFQLPRIVPMEVGKKVILEYRKDLALETFPVKHALSGKRYLPSMGATLFTHKNKLKEEYLHCTTSEIIALRKQGVQITREVFDPTITFMGDNLGDNLLDESLSSIWNSEILVTECTFLDDGEQDMAKNKGHTHIGKIVDALKKYGTDIHCKQIILTHFSMKYSVDHILETIQKNIPDEFKDRVSAFV